MTAQPYFIGQVLPYEGPQPVQHGDCEPCWYIFQTPPRKEASATAWLDQRGVEAWHPVTTKIRRVPRSRIKSVPYETPVAPRYLFARFTGRPQWHVLKTCRWITRVVGVEDRPMPVTDEVMGLMASVPERLEIIKRREIEKRIIRPGDKARIGKGPLEGWIVDVSEVHAGIARFTVPLFGARSGVANLDDLHKIVAPSKGR